MTQTLSDPTWKPQRKLESWITTTDVPVVILPCTEDRIPPTLDARAMVGWSASGMESGVEVPGSKRLGKGGVPVPVGKKEQRDIFWKAVEHLTNER